MLIIDHPVQQTVLFAYIVSQKKDIRLILLDFSLTVKTAPHACVIRTGQS